MMLQTPIAPLSVGEIWASIQLLGQDPVGQGVVRLGDHDADGDHHEGCDAEGQDGRGERGRGSTDVGRDVGFERRCFRDRHRLTSISEGVRADLRGPPQTVRP